MAASRSSVVLKWTTLFWPHRSILLILALSSSLKSFRISSSSAKFITKRPMMLSAEFLGAGEGADSMPEPLAVPLAAGAFSSLGAGDATGAGCGVAGFGCWGGRDVVAVGLGALPCGCLGAVAGAFVGAVCVAGEAEAGRGLWPVDGATGAFAP
jgi:hypothetical protein